MKEVEHKGDKHAARTDQGDVTGCEKRHILDHKKENHRCDHGNKIPEGPRDPCSQPAVLAGSSKLAMEEDPHEHETDQDEWKVTQADPGSFNRQIARKGEEKPEIHNEDLLEQMLTEVRKTKKDQGQQNGLRDFPAVQSEPLFSIGNTRIRPSEPGL